MRTPRQTTSHSAADSPTRRGSGTRRGLPRTADSGAPVGEGGLSYRLLLVPILALVVIASLLIARAQGGLDDAFISYRYARNFAAGHGLVFNPGERVEGFSNLLYVLMLVPAFRLGLEGGAIYSVSVALNTLASLLALLYFAAHLTRRFGPRGALLGTLLLAAWPTLSYWNSTGLETAWLLLFQVVAWISVERLLEGERHALLPAALASVVCALLRSDGFVVPLLLALYLLLRGQRRAALAVGAATGLTALGIVAWQWRYYGQALSNPYYIKVCGPLLARVSAGLHTLAGYRTLWLYWLMLGLAGGAAAVAWVRTRDFGRVSAGLFVSLGLFLYVLVIGGDFLGERFLLIQAFVAVAGLFAADLLPTRDLRLPVALVVGTVLLYHVAAPTNGTLRLPDLLLDRGKHIQGTFWGELGRYLRVHQPGKTLAIDAVGLTPYYSGLYTIDMLGLCDKHIAHVPPAVPLIPGHSKYDPEYLLGRRPGLIAAWAANDRGDLLYGLTRARWSGAYRVRYLVYAENVAPPPGTPYVIDVADLAPADVSLRIREGYRYVVLERTAAGGGG